MDAITRADRLRKEIDSPDTLLIAEYLEVIASLLSAISQKVDKLLYDRSDEANQ